MMQLNQSISAWGSPDFESILKHEIAQNTGQLPLQQGLSVGNYVIDAPVTVLICRVNEFENMLRVHIGIFYQGIIGGCSCADDPSPSGETTEYCDVLVEIDKTNAATTVTLVVD